MKRKILTILCLFVLVSCATTKQSKGPVKTETLTTLHFITFRTNPPGANVIVVDLMSGKEISSLGTTPVRILVLRKTIDIYSNGGVKCTNISSNAGGTTTGSKNPDGVEFQFKFRMQGYYDEIKVERIPLLYTEETDKSINVVLTKEQK